MKWISNDYTKNLVHTYGHLIPKDFDPSIYILLHPDLIAAGIDDEQKAKEHYIIFGMKENRIYKKDPIIEYPDYNTDSKPEIWNQSSNSILYFSPNAPDYDMSSGGNRLLQILRILKHDLDYDVWFMCNGSHSISHIESIKSLGIPIYMPDTKAKKYLSFYLEEAKNNNINFSNAIFSWYDIARQYLSIVKSLFPNIKTIIDSVDVHWLREQRGKDSGQLDISQEIIDIRKSMEKKCYSSCDVVFAVTESDRQVLQNELPTSSTIKVLSNIHTKNNLKLGDNLFFIGNYSHAPNVQAAMESIKIYKAFQQTKQYKTLKNKPKLYLVGPNITDKVSTLTSDNQNIIITGQITDLHSLYQENNLLLAPLYWGAGIKGKICDAGMCGLPVLTTDIGNEGISFKNKVSGLIANNTDEFIDSLCYFYGLERKDQIDLGRRCQEHLNNIVSVDAAKNILYHSLKTKPILISIVTYNQTEKLLKCIDSILDKTSYSNYKIVISDNSNNNTTKNAIKNYIKKYSNKIEYIKNQKNEYFIKPNNKIIKRYKDYDIVLINDDIEIITSDWLSYLYSAAYTNHNICASGGKTIFPDGRLAEAGAELYNDGTGRNIGRYGNPKNKIYNIQKYTGYCSGCLLYMRRDAIEKIGALSNELQLMYYEDSEWQYRAHANGLKTIYEPRCEAIHHEGSSSGTDITKGMKRYQEINRLIFLKLMKTYDWTDIESLNE